MVWGLLARRSWSSSSPGAELFTNGIEWIGEGFGLSEGAVGSVLAAVGPRCPRRCCRSSRSSQVTGRGDEIGIGAILGAPFMLTTLAMVVIARDGAPHVAQGASEHRPLLRRPGVFGRTSGYFLVMYSLALIAGLLDSKPFNSCLVIVLLVGLRLYVRRHFQTPASGESDGVDIKPLYVWQGMRTFKRSLPVSDTNASVPVPFVQVGIALALIIGGAELFIHAIDDIADRVRRVAAGVLVAGRADRDGAPGGAQQRLIWVRRRKDILALGNITGAMVFQATFPVTIGLLFTPWRLDHSPPPSRLRSRSSPRVSCSSPRP